MKRSIPIAALVLLTLAPVAAADSTSPLVLLTLAPVEAGDPVSPLVCVDKTTFPYEVGVGAMCTDVSITITPDPDGHGVIVIVCAAHICSPPFKIFLAYPRIDRIIQF